MQKSFDRPMQISEEIYNIQSTMSDSGLLSQPSGADYAPHIFRPVAIIVSGQVIVF